MELMSYSDSWRRRPEINNLQDAFIFRAMPYRSSEFIHSRTTDELNEWENAVERAMHICKTNGLPVERNFRPMYVVSEQGIVKDWMLSSLARKLVLLNASPNNMIAARLQMQLLELAETAPPGRTKEI